MMVKWWIKIAWEYDAGDWDLEGVGRQILIPPQTLNDSWLYLALMIITALFGWMEGKWLAFDHDQGTSTPWNW